MQTFWNQRYSEDRFVYGEKPNAFFKTVIDLTVKGKLLLPADGEGRNGVYAAKTGWEVDAFDFSTTAKTKAMNLAQKQAVHLNYQTTDIQSFEFPTDHYDLVGLFFVHLPPELRVFLHKKVIQTLKPGGKLVLEAFNKAQMPLTTGGPKNESMLFDQQMLNQDFKALEIIHLVEKRVILDEGPYHSGEAEVIRLIAKKV